MSRYFSELFRKGDILFFMLFFGIGIIYAFEFSARERQFPLLFLILGAISITIEYSLYKIPDRYSEPIREYTLGVTSDVENSVGSSVENDPDNRENPDSRLYGLFSIESHSIRAIVAILALIVFISLSATVNFIIAIPVFIIGITYILGTQNAHVAIISSIIISIVIYIIFGQIMNVPVV